MADSAMNMAGTSAWKGGYADCTFGQIHFIVHHPSSDRLASPLIMLNPRSRSCRRLLPYLPARSLYIVDIPGLGLSTPIPPGTAMAEVGRAIGEFMEAVNVEKAHIYGIHTGNKVAAALVQTCPDKALSLTVCGKTHSIVIEPETRNFAMKAQVDAVKPDVALVRFEGKYIDEDRDSIEAVPRLYHANFSFDLEAALASTEVPVLVIEITSTEETALYGLQGQALARRARHGQYRALEQTDPAGLDMYVGADRMGQAMRDFISA